MKGSNFTSYDFKNKDKILYAWTQWICQNDLNLSKQTISKHTKE